MNSSVTDFLFKNSSIASSRDTVLINFLQLLAARKLDWDVDTPFVAVNFLSNLGICLINGTNFDENQKTWANGTYTESCPYPFVAPGNGSLGCPQILATGPVQGCGSGPGLVPCLTTPVGVDCPPTGCPVAPGGDPFGIGSATSAAPLFAAFSLIFFL
jgi:hypothetical protein